MNGGIKLGKYPPSPIHNMFSNWHFKKCGYHAALTDIDRMWVEMRYKKLVTVFDLKTPYEYMNYSEPETEKILRNFFEKQNIPYYIMIMDCANGLNHPIFILIRKEKKIELSEKEMIDFINNLPKSIASFENKQPTKTYEKTEIKELHEVMQ